MPRPMPRKKTNRNTAQLLAILAILILGGAAAFALSQVMIDRDAEYQNGTQNGIQSGVANVDTLDIAVMESFPVQVRAVARGYLPDSCTEIDDITQTRSGNTFTVSITTTRPSDAYCAQVLKPFEENISLRVSGLLKGTYTVNVNGVRETFTLSTDNVPTPPAGTSTQP